MWRWEARERRFRASTRRLHPSLWRPRYNWDARRIRGRDGSEDFLQPSAVRNSRKRLDSNNFLASSFSSTRICSASVAETVTFASVTQRESNRLHDAPLLYTPRTITRSLHFPARTPGKARGAGGTRVAGTSRTSPLVAGRARARPRSRAPRPSRARILIGRSGRSGRDDRDTSTSRLPRALDPGPGLSPSSRWARRSSSPPGARLTPTAATRWRSRRRCPTARWRRSGSSRPTTGRDDRRMGGGTLSTASTSSSAPLRGMRRGGARAHCLSTTRDGLAFRDNDLRSGPGGRPGVDGGTRRAPIQPLLRASSDSAAAVRRPRDGVWVRARAGRRHHERSLGVGHRSIAFEKPFAASSRTPTSTAICRRGALARRRPATRTSPRERVSAPETILSRSAKRYVSPSRSAREASDDPRVEGEGEWPNPKPPVVVIPGKVPPGSPR